MVNKEIQDERRAREDALATCSAGISRKIDQLRSMQEALNSKAEAMHRACDACELQLREEFNARVAMKGEQLEQAVRERVAEAAQKRGLGIKYTQAMR